MTATIRYMLIAVLALALSGCGYSVKRSPVASVSIGNIENMTTEAKLEDRLAEALVASFMKNGIKIDSGSSHTVVGTLQDLELRQFAEENGVTTVYEIVIKGEFLLTKPESDPVKLPGSGKYIVTFSSQGALTPVLSYKELAINQALTNVAEEISAAVLYMR